MVVIKQYSTAQIDQLNNVTGRVLYDSTLNVLKFNDSQVYDNILLHKDRLNNVTGVNNFITSGNLGINTSSPDKQVEINSSTGDCLRLTYNDNNGSADNYTDLNVSNSGDLTISPSGGDTIINSILSISNTNSSTSSTTGALKLVGGIGISNNTDAISSANGGSFTTAGGAAIAKSLYVGQNVSIGGDLTVLGTTTTVNSTVVELTDNTLKLNSGPAGTGYDSGLINNRYQLSNDVGSGDVVSDPAKETYSLNNATNDTITLPSTANSNNNYYQKWWIKITSGDGQNQVRQIISYDGTTKVATLDSTFTTNPVEADSVELFNKTLSTFLWQENNNRFITAFAAKDAPAGQLEILDYADFACNKANIINNDSSTSNSTGALTLAGGIGISNTTDASSYTNGGTFTTAGGAAIAKKLYVGTDLDVGNNVSLTNNLSVGGNTSLSGDLTVSGQINLNGTLALTGPTAIDNTLSVTGAIDFSSTVDAVSYTNGGCLTVSGGTAIAKKLFVGSHLDIGGNTILNGTLGVSNKVSFNDSTDAISSTNGGSLTISGGVAVAKKLFIGTDLDVGANTILNGNLSVSGPILSIPTGNTSARPSTPQVGYIRYNSETSQFEGYGAGNAWGSLGGVSDVNQDTKILAEMSAGSNDDNLRFFNHGIETMRLTEPGLMGLGTTNPDKQLEINSSTGDCLRLTYNDNNGSASNYADFLVSNEGNLSITPSSKIIVLGNSFNTRTCIGTFSNTGTDGLISFVNDNGTCYLQPSLNTTGGSAADFVITNYSQGTSDSSRIIMFKADGKTGFGTDSPDKQLEINSSTGDCLRLTYNDKNGSANNYSDFTISNSGDLTISPSGNDTNINSKLNVTGIVSFSDTTDATSISNGGCLTISGGTAIAKKLYVGTDFSVTGNSSMTGTLVVTGATTLSDTLGVTGATTLSDTLGVTGATTLSDTLGVTGATTLSDTLGVTGATTLSSTLGVIGATSLSNTLGVIGATTLSSTLGVTGATTLSDTLDVTGAATLSDTLDVTGATILSDTLDVTGAATLSDTLDVTGAATLSSTLSATGAITFSNTTDATNSTTGGCLTISGGAAVAKKLYVGTDLLVSGNALLSGTLSIDGALTLSNTDDATNSTNGGCLTVSGGAAVAKKLYVGSNLNVTGETSLSSTLVVTDAATFSNNVTINNGSSITVNDTNKQFSAIAGALEVSNTINSETNGHARFLTHSDGVAYIQTGTEKVENSAADLFIGNYYCDITTSTRKIIFKANGNVGIGMATPSRVLDITGTFGATGAATLGSTLAVTGATTLSSTLAVTGATTLSNTLSATGAVTFSNTTDAISNTTGGCLTISGGAAVAKKLFVGTDLSIGGNSGLNGTLNVSGAVSITNTTDASSISSGGSLTISGGTAIAKKLYVGTDFSVTGNSSLTGTLGVTGAATFSSTVSISGAFTLSNTSDATSSTNGGCLTVSGGAAVAKKLYVGTDFSVGGNSSMTGSFSVTGAATLSNNLSVSGDSTLTGNVGIGTTVPDKKVEINSATGDCLRLTYDDSNGSATNYSDLLVSNTGDLVLTPSSGNVNITTHNGSTSGLTLNGTLITSTASELNYVDTTPGLAEASKAIVLDSNRDIVNINYFEAANGVFIKPNAANNTIDFPLSLIVTPNTTAGIGLGTGIEFNSVNDNSDIYNAGYINYVSTDITNNEETGYFDFKLANSGSIDSIMTVANNGVVTCTSFVETSDMRVKENIQDTLSLESLNKILDIQIKSYNFKKDRKKIKHTGVIAQELKEILPEAVVINPHDEYDDFHSVHYTELIPHLVNCIKELYKELQDLKNKN
jgi:hypothetical protein